MNTNSNDSNEDSFEGNSSPTQGEEQSILCGISTTPICIQGFSQVKDST